MNSFFSPNGKYCHSCLEDFIEEYECFHQDESQAIIYTQHSRIYYILAFVSMLYKIYNHLPPARETRVKFFSAFTHDEKRISGKQANLCLMFFNYV